MISIAIYELLRVTVRGVMAPSAPPAILIQSVGCQIFTNLYAPCISVAKAANPPHLFPARPLGLFAWGRLVFKSRISYRKAKKFNSVWGIDQLSRSVTECR